LFKHFQSLRAVEYCPVANFLNSTPTPGAQSIGRVDLAYGYAGRFDIFHSQFYSGAWQGNLYWFL